MAREVGIIGLGDMGGNIAMKLHENGYSLVLYNKTAEKYEGFRKMDRVRVADSLEQFAGMLGNNAIVWMMIPGGSATNETAEKLSALLGPGAIVIDASNSFYLDSAANAKRLAERSVYYLDVGFAGGPSDIFRGAAIMVGGDRGAFDGASDIFRILSGKRGYEYLGASGAGHMAKLGHNMIFYAIGPGYAEGVAFLAQMRKSFGGDFDMQKALKLYAASPAINGDIMEAMAAAMERELPNENPSVSKMMGFGAEHAEKLGINLAVTKAVLASYSTMAETPRRLWAAAKKIVTGHY